MFASLVQLTCKMKRAVSTALQMNLCRINEQLDAQLEQLLATNKKV